MKKVLLLILVTLLLSIVNADQPAVLNMPQLMERSENVFLGKVNHISDKNCTMKDGNFDRKAENLIGQYEYCEIKVSIEVLETTRGNTEPGSTIELIGAEFERSTGITYTKCAIPHIILGKEYMFFPQGKSISSCDGNPSPMLLSGNLNAYSGIPIIHNSLPVQDDEKNKSIKPLYVWVGIILLGVALLLYRLILKRNK